MGVASSCCRLVLRAGGGSRGVVARSSTWVSQLVRMRTARVHDFCRSCRHALAHEPGRQGFAWPRLAGVQESPQSEEAGVFTRNSLCMPARTLHEGASRMRVRSASGVVLE